MSSMTRFLSLLLMASVVAGGLLVAGCGEKIAIPVPEGVYSNTPYEYFDTYDDPDAPLQLTQFQGVLYVVGPGALTKRNQAYDELGRVEGLSQATAVCVEPDSGWVFVWEDGPKRVSWYDSDDMSLIGSSVLDVPGPVVAMETNPEGIDLVLGALTFLYLSDPDNGVVHRYAFDVFNGLSPYGILTRADGDAARFVHVAAGMATDYAGRLLVCDADTNRNWVIRFDSRPDTTDVTSDPNDQDPLRGRAILFDLPTCNPPAAADFVLGNAAACEQLDWTGGPSDADGEFHANQGVGVDSGGQILVADTMNNRIQIFDSTGNFQLFFPTDGSLNRPVCVAPVEKRTGTDTYPSALVYILLADTGQVALYQQSAYKNDPGRGP